MDDVPDMGMEGKEGATEPEERKTDAAVGAVPAAALQEPPGAAEPAAPPEASPPAAEAAPASGSPEPPEPSLDDEDGHVVEDALPVDAVLLGEPAAEDLAPARAEEADAAVPAAVQGEGTAASGAPAAEAGAAMTAAEGAPAADGAIYRVKILYCSATEFCQSQPGVQIAAGDMVVVPTKYGHEVGRVLGFEPAPVDCSPEELKTIVRKTTPADMSRVGENELKQEKAFDVCREKISLRGLEMKLVSAHYLLDEQKILFFFTAENRIDFRELVKDLVAVFKTRIELRQIGVRDEARVLGGVGICGRVLCCNSITDRLRPVSIKMAKEQNLTLNSMKISGPCGRLLCCLAYEFDVYKEARQHFPPQGTRIPYDGEQFKVAEINVLARRLRLQGESGRVLDLGFDGLTRNTKTNSWEIRVRTAPGQ